MSKRLIIDLSEEDYWKVQQAKVLLKAETWRDFIMIVTEEVLKNGGL